MTEESFYKKNRNEGIHIVASRGSGKSRLLGRHIAMDDYIQEIPTVVFDNGDTIDNFLDVRRRFFQHSGLTDYGFSERIVYVPVGWEMPFKYHSVSELGSRVTHFPLYYGLGNESAFDVSQRFVETVRRLDPDLSGASIQGYNPLWQIGTMAGKILVALDMQITEMLDLMLHTDLWEGRFREALAKDPAVADAVEFFTLQYPKWPEQWKASLVRKLTLFTADDNLRAMFGKSKPFINWQEVVNKKQMVLLDFRGVHNEELSRFLMLWIFSSLRDFVLYRGTGGSPISIIVDELSSMMNLSDTSGTSLIAKDLDRLLNTIMRRHNLWITFAHQAMNQFPDSIQALLLGMGTQVMGRIDNMDDALHLAKSFFPVDPLKTKRTVTRERPGKFLYLYIQDPDPYPDKPIDSIVQAGDGWTKRKISQSSYYSIKRLARPAFDDKRGYYEIVSNHLISKLNKYWLATYDEFVNEPVEYTIPEQHYDNANTLVSLPKFYFLVRMAGENRVGWHSIEKSKDFIDQVEVDRDKEMLWFNRMPDESVQDVAKAIQGRLEKPQAKPQPQPKTDAPSTKQPDPKIRIIGKRLND